MKNPKFLLLGISILIFTATSKAHNPNNLMSTLRSEISERRQLGLNGNQPASIINNCMQNCNRNWDDAKAYKCSVSNPVTHEAGFSLQFPMLIFQCTIFLNFYLIPFLATPSNAAHFHAGEARSLLQFFRERVCCVQSQL